MDNIQNNLDNDNLKNESNNKFSKVKEIVLKDKNERDTYRDCARINNLISEAEDKKFILLMEMGILAYKKIRDGYIEDEDFDSISNSILELDKFIYDSNVDLIKLKRKNDTINCECGNKINNQDKFCSVCGKKS